MKHSFYIIALIAAMCISGCGNPSEPAAQTSSQTESQIQVSEVTPETAEDTEEVTETAVKEDIGEMTDNFTMDDYTEPVCGGITNDAPLYQDERITITADSFETDSTDTYLFLVIENTSDQDLSISCTSSALNNYMIDSGFTDDVAAHDTLETALRFENTFINACGIHTITSAELVFSVFDLSDYSLLAETGTLTVTTDADPASAQSDIVNGELLYSQDNFQIINKGILEDDTGMAMIALLFVNQSGRDMSVRLAEDAMLVDDTEYISLFTAGIPDGKNGIFLLSLYDPEQGNIPFEESVKVSFVLQDTNTWEDLYTTEPVTILREQL